MNNNLFVPQTPDQLKIEHLEKNLILILNENRKLRDANFLLVQKTLYMTVLINFFYHHHIGCKHF